MQCRHTVPDWHRYVDPEGVRLPIFAGCRLLVKEGERVGDPRGIACAYWGRQRECPLYEGPGERIAAAPLPPQQAPDPEAPLPPEPIWPVRGPERVDWIRGGLAGLAVGSGLLLGWALLEAILALRADAPSGRLAPVTLAAAAAALADRTLRRLAAWAGR